MNNERMARVQITRLNDLNTLVIKKSKDSNFFISSKNSFIISIPNLAYVIKFLLFTKLLSPKVIEGILEEYKDHYE